MYIKDIRRNRKHYLDDKSESILSNLSSINGLSSNVYELFRNMDKKQLYRQLNMKLLCNLMIEMKE